MDLTPAEVTCYSGHRGSQEPRTFTIGDRSFEVREIESRWREEAPEEPGLYRESFRVTTGGGETFTLTHHLRSDSWEARG